MHRDEAGRLHLSIVVFGAWSRTLDYDLVWLNGALPLRFARMRKMVMWESVWYSQVQCVLPPENGRTEIVQIHVSSMTGTIWLPMLQKYLLDHADGVIFAAEAELYRLEATKHDHALLERWIEERGERAFIVYQRDESQVTSTSVEGVEEPVVRLSIDELREALGTGERPWLSTTAYMADGVGPVFRKMIKMLIDAEAAGQLLALPLPAPIEAL